MVAQMKENYNFNFQLPRSVVLPGVRITVKYTDLSDTGEDGIWVYSHAEGTATILIDASLPLPVQRYVLLHELGHAMLELVDIGLEHAADQVQTKSMAILAGRRKIPKEIRS